jgi:hypothetical protein
MTIEKTHIIKINKTPEEVKTIFEKAIREEDESVVFPTEYEITFEPNVNQLDLRYCGISINLEIPEPRKPGRPKGSRKSVSAATADPAGDKGTSTSAETDVTPT